LGVRTHTVWAGNAADRMFEDLIANPKELERVQRLFLERAVAAMRDVGMTEDQISEALGRHDPQPATVRPIGH
jgi:hypothetical protein